MKKLLSTALVCALAVSAMPAFASESSEATTTATARQNLRASIQQIVDQTALGSPQVALSAVAAPRPYSGPDRSRKQMGGGGSKTGMIIGIVGSLVGAAATVYMVKEMKKSTDAASKQQ